MVHLYRRVATAALRSTRRPGKKPGIGAGKAPGDGVSPPTVTSSVKGTGRGPRESENMAVAKRLRTRLVPVTPQNVPAAAAVWIHPDDGAWRTSLPCSAWTSTRTPDPSAGYGRRESSATSTSLYSAV